jgi:hypothetical protein
MMNAAMDRWGVGSSSIYNNLNKENDSKTLNSNDSKKKRKPLSQKQQKKQQQQQQHLQHQELPTILDPKPSGKTGDQSYSDGSSTGSNGNGKGSKRQSGPVAQILGSETTETETSDEDVDLPPPIHNVIQTPRNEQEMNDVSTIAGDTFAGIEMDASVAEAVPPYHLGISISPYDSAYDIPMPLAPEALGQTMDGAMITPTYSVLRQEKKSRRRVFLDDDDDDDQSTLPESPDNNEDEYGFVEEGTSKSRVLSKKKQNSDHKKSFYSDDNDDDQPALPRFEGEKKFETKVKAPRKRRFRCMMCTGCFLAFLLLLGIASLGYTLYAIRNEDKGAVSMFTRAFWTNAGTKLAFWKNDDEEAVDAFSGTTAPSYPYTHWSSTNTGTSMPTQFDSTINIVPVVENIDSPKMEELRSIVLSATIEKSIPGINGTALNDPASVQYDVLQWLSFDTLLDTYSEEKILQRYALGCFYESVMGEDNDEIDTSKSNAVRSTWMGYGDECTEWASTEVINNDKKQTCNENGQIRSIHLENIGLTGTLAPELALLSDSLRTFLFDYFFLFLFTFHHSAIIILFF